VEIFVGRLFRLLLKLEVRGGRVPPRGLLAEGELEAVDERGPLRSDRGLVALRVADGEPPVLRAVAEVLGRAGDGHLILHGMVAHPDGVHAPDERLGREGVVKRWVLTPLP
jgi:hypothetical protein